MITEDYVSFETAKLLKEKGFDEKVDTLYKIDAEFLKSTLCINYNDAKFALLDMHNIPENTVSAPTLQMAMKWLREKHLIFFDLFHIIGDIENGEEFRIGIYEKTRTDTYTWKNWIQGETCEKTYEKAIKYCLENLI